VWQRRRQTSRDLNHHRDRHARPEFPTPTACQPPQTPRSDRWTPDFAGALGNQRRYPRHVLRRLAFITAAQRVGLSLEETATALNTLPAGRAPTRADWTRLSRPWQRQIAARIRELESLQNTLAGCLGCGCLSLTRCKLYNPDDQADREGPGSRWLRDARYPA